MYTIDEIMQITQSEEHKHPLQERMFYVFTGAKRWDTRLSAVDRLSHLSKPNRWFLVPSARDRFDSYPIEIAFVKNPHSNEWGNFYQYWSQRWDTPLGRPRPNMPSEAYSISHFIRNTSRSCPHLIIQKTQTPPTRGDVSTFTGANDGTRTHDLILTKDALYQLSYAGL